MKRLYTIVIVIGMIILPAISFAQFLSLSWPLDRSVVQQSSGSATIHVAGQLIGCPDSYERLQMRIEKLNKFGAFESLVQDYSDISRDNGGLGLFHEQPYLSKGWYHIIVKAVNSGGTIVAINDVKAGIGNVFIIAGQSNAQSIKESNGVAPLLPTDAAYDCVVSNSWEGLCDWKTSPTPAYVPFPLFPMFSKLSSGNKIAPNGYNQWAYARLGNLQVDGTNAPVAFFNAASPTTDIASWKTSSDGGAVTGMPFLGHPCSTLGLPNNSGLPYKRLKQSLNYYASMFGARGVLWHQGEAETEQKQSNPSYNSDYVNKLNYVIGKSRTDYGYTIPWFVSKSATLISKKVGTTWTYGIVNATVQGNQATVAALNNNGATTDAKNQLFRHPQDYTHLNENAGINKGLSFLADSWQANIGNSGSGFAPQTFPTISMSYNSTTDVYTAYAPSGYSDYKWVIGNGDLDRGVGSGSSASSVMLAGAGMRCWVKNSTGNWTITQIVYAQTCRSGARTGEKDNFETEDLLGNKLSVYPNPSNQISNIKFELARPANVQLNIISLTGQIIRNVANNFHAKGLFTYPVDVSTLPEGIYLCQLKAGDISMVKKLVVGSKK